MYFFNKFKKGQVNALIVLLIVGSILITYGAMLMSNKLEGLGGYAPSIIGLVSFGTGIIIVLVILILILVRSFE